MTDYSNSKTPCLWLTSKWHSWKKFLLDSSTLLNKDCFIYSGSLTLEAYLTDQIALLVSARERALFGSDIGKFHTQVSLGLKFIIN